MTISLKSLQDRTVLITGGSSGIGLALARLAAAQGAHLWLLGRRQELLKQALAQLNSLAAEVHILASDVSDWTQVEKAVAHIEQESGVPDLVINSAGVTHPGYVQDIPVEIFRQMMDINYMGTVHVVKALLPGMLARGSGYIVNISSGAGFVGIPGYTAYGASKYAVRGFSEVLRAELKPLGIGVSIAFPPDTDTPQLAYENKFKPPLTKVLVGGVSDVHTPDEVAKAILAGVRRGHYIILPGFETNFFYHLIALLGNTWYPLADYLVARAWRSLREKAKT